MGKAHSKSKKLLPHGEESSKALEIARLPRELLLKILGYLDPASLKNLSLCSTYCHAAAWEFNEVLLLKSDRKQKLEFLRHFHLLSYIRVLKLTTTAKELDSDSSLSTQFPNLSSLQLYLDLSGPDLRSAKAKLEKLSVLQKLTLCIERYCLVSYLKAIPKNVGLTSLGLVRQSAWRKELPWKSEPLVKIGKLLRFSTLQELEVDDEYAFSSRKNKAITILTALTMLESLYLSNAHFADFSPWIFLTRLKTLSLRRSSCSAAGLANLTALTSLRSLTLHFSIRDGPPTVLDFLRYCSRLTHLDLSFNLITNEHLPALAGLQRLELLSLSQTQTSSKGYKYLTGLRKLRKLWVSNYRQQTVASVMLANLPQLEIIPVDSYNGSHNESYGNPSDEDN